MKYCSQCGNPMDDDMRFCQQCGTKYKDTIDASVKEEVAVKEPVHTPTADQQSGSTAGSDFITTQILNLVKNAERLDLPKLKSVRENLKKYEKNKLVSSSKKVRDLLAASIKTVDEQIYAKEEAIRKKREQEEEEARIRKAEAELAKAQRKQKVAAFINAHPNAYLSVNNATNDIVPSKKLILCIAAVFLFVAVVIAIGGMVGTGGNTPNVKEPVSNTTGDFVDSNDGGNSFVETTVPVVTEPPLNAVNVTIKCDANLFFSTYDLKIYLNDEHQGNVDHGDTEEFQFELDDGTYTLMISSKDSSSVKGEITFTVTDDTNIEYRIKCHSDKVDITQEHFEIMRPLTESETKTPNDYDHYIDKPYETVVDDLKAAGFTNIATAELRDLKDYEDDDVGEVATVSIGGRTDFNAGEIFEKDTEIVVTYHVMEPSAEEMNAIITNREGAAAADILASFEGTGYTIICYVQEKEITNFTPDGYFFVSGSLDTSDKIAYLHFTTQELIDLANNLEAFLPQEMAKRVAVVAMTNCQATDVFHNDGNTYNTSKFHKYSDISGFYLSVVSNGTWTAKDEQTWHVSDMKFMLSGYSTYLKASMDITFDGKNYVVSNVDKTIASKDYIDSTDPSKVNVEHLEPSEYTPYLTVAPSLVEEDRDAAAERVQNDKTMSTSTRSSWISNQFSLWDGEHKKLKEMIKSNLNDEKSYDHIETTYYDLTSQELVDMVNQILKSAGYSQRVEIGDLFIMCEFSAKNAFNATIKNTAYAIAHYDENTIELIGIE